MEEVLSIPPVAQMCIQDAKEKDMELVLCAHVPT